MSNLIDTSVAPYYDDYAETDKYIKILFRPDVSVQARELNQLQTMYQKQLSRFADHMFANGSVVIPGSLIPDFKYRYLKIESDYADGAEEDLNDDLTDYVGKRVKSKTGDLVATVRNSTVATDTDPATLYIDYLNQDGVNKDNAAFSAAEVLEILDTDDSVLREITVAASNPTGLGTAVHIKEGVYYVNEYFHLVLDQTIIVSKYSNTPSVSVGFTITDDIITSIEDTNLLDNAVGSANESAPGGHRYKSELVLGTKTLNSDGTELGASQTGDFIQLVKIINGEVVDIARTPTYSIIEESAARRTDETNGSFIIDPFTLTFTAHLETNLFPGRYTEAQGGDYDKFVYILDSGQAYVNGFRAEKLSSTYINANRARVGDHIKEKNNVPTACDLGQYVIGTLDTSDDALPSLTDYPEIKIFDDSSTPVEIGTCRIRAIRAVSGDDYRFYIFAINMNSGKTFIEDAKSLRFTDPTYANFQANLEQVGSKAVVYEPESSPAIFPMAFGPMKGITDVSYTTTETFDADASGSPAEFTVATGASNRTLINSNLILINLTTGAVVPDANYSVAYGVNNTQVTVSGAGVTAGQRYRLFIDVQNVSVSDTTTYKLRTKTLQTATLSSVAAASEISLGQADVFTIRVLDANGNDVSYKYQLDSGQRDGYYDIARLILAPGQTQTGNLDIDIAYFAHSDGDYFAANSYSADDYARIQFYEASNGQKYDLTNCLDFRPTISSDGTFTGAGSVAGNNIAPNTLFTADFEYYVGRYDLIVLNQDGDFQVITGQPADIPKKPKNTTSGIVLHEVLVPAYTYDVQDIRARALEYRRYTMSDIARLEDRLANVEYYTALNLLEKNTNDLSIKDGSGNEKFKNGFLIDNFSNQSNGDITNVGYRFSIDIDFGEGHPEVSTKNVMMGADALNSTNVTIHDNGIVTLPYTEEAWAAQTQSTGDISVNPYAMYFWRGTLDITPESDVWFSTVFTPDVIVDGGVIDNVGNANIGTVWNNWQTVWSGTNFEVTGIEDTVEREWRGGSRERAWELHLEAARNQWRAARDLGIDFFNPDGTTDWTRIPDGTGGIDRGMFRRVRVETANIAQVTTNVQNRSGVRSFVNTSVQRQVIDNRVVSQAAVPWIRARRITFRAEGLKPETKHWVFFDETDVSQYSAETSPVSRAKGEYIITDASGVAEGYFDIPNTPSARFRTGTRTLSLYNLDDINTEGGDSVADATYSARGVLTTRQRTIESTRVRNLVSQNVRDSRTTTDTNEIRISERTVLTGWLDPLAQSFLTTQRGGSFLTSIEVPFTQKDASIPVTLQVRNMVNGYPGVEVLPFGEVTLYPADVTVDASGISWTKFTFAAPVYIQEEVEYCFVLLSNSNEYRVRVANMAEKDIVTGTYVSKQPYNGVFFKSQNGTTWTADQDTDMTFRINRASFSQTSGTLRATPTVPDYEDGFESDPFQILISDPFEALSGSDRLKVYHPNHDMFAGNEVTYTVPDDNSVVFGGVNVQNNIDGRTFTVDKVINADEYYISLAGQSITANDSGRFGGDNIVMTSNVAFDILNLNSTNLLIGATDLTAKIKTSDHNVIASRSLDTAWTTIPFNQNIFFDETRSLIEGEDDFQLEIDFATERSNLSPVIDLERLSGFYSRNRINNIESNAENLDYHDWVTFRSDSENISSSFAKYISKTVTLETAANSLHVYLDANRRFGADIEVWYKTIGAEDSTSISNQSWVQMTQESYPSISTRVGEFKEYSWKVEGIDDYTTYKVKIVLKSEETASAPTIKNFRAIAATQ